MAGEGQSKKPLHRYQVFGVLLTAGSDSRLGMGPKALLRKNFGSSLQEDGMKQVVVVLKAGDRVAVLENDQ